MTDRLCYLLGYILGYIGGVGLLLLAFFITYQVTVQNLDWAHIRGKIPSAATCSRWPQLGT